MAASDELTLTLPPELAEIVKAEIGSGRYASATEVVGEALHALARGRDDALEAWLRDEVAEGRREYLADPSKAVPADEVLGLIKSRRHA